MFGSMVKDIEAETGTDPGRRGNEAAAAATNEEWATTMPPGLPDGIPLVLSQQSLSKPCSRVSPAGMLHGCVYVCE